MSIASAETFRSPPRFARGAGLLAALRAALAGPDADEARAASAFTVPTCVTAAENRLADDEFDALLLGAARPSPEARSAA